jgi:hypothetical protein
MRAAKCFRTFGMVILISGLLATGVIFGCARRNNDLDPLSGERYTKHTLLELEKMGGQSYVLFTSLNDWFVSLWQGRRLAYTIGVLSVAGFWVAIILGTRSSALGRAMVRTLHDEFLLPEIEKQL